MVSREAIQFSVKSNQIPARSIRVGLSFFHSEEDGTLYYGVILRNGERSNTVNAGLNKTGCGLVEINYVTERL